MRPKAEIKKSIRDNLPIAFGQSESVDRSEFLEKYNALLDSATAVSEPFLAHETVRYQSMVLYASLLLVSVTLLQFGTIKIGDNVVTVNHKLLALYSIFIAAIVVLFLIKAYVDSERADLVVSRNERALYSARQLISLGLLKRRIEEYFWLEIQEKIERAYKAFDDASSDILKSPRNSNPSSLSPLKDMLNVDLTEFRKVPELAAVIAAHEKHLSELADELAGDEARFRDAAELILSTGDTSPGGLPDGYERMRKKYDEHLRNWSEARTDLANEHLEFKFEEMESSQEVRQLNAIIKVLERMKKIRSIYPALEIAAPVAFAAAAVAICWYR